MSGEPFGRLLVPGPRGTLWAVPATFDEVVEYFSAVANWNAKARRQTIAEQYLAARKRALGPLRAKQRAAFMRAVRASSDSAKLRRLTDAVASGRPEAIEAALNWPAVAQPIIDQALRSIAIEAAQYGGAAGIRLGIGNVLGARPFTLDIMHEAAADWFRSNSRIAVGRLANVRTEALRALLTEAANRGTEAPQVARDIMRLRLVGLHPRQIRMIANRAREMRLSNIPAPLAARRLQLLSDRQLRYRAETIAIDQTTRAYAAGQRLGWEQAQREGLIDRRAYAEWIVVDPCEICEPYAGTTAPIGSRFAGNLWPGEVHPRCECMAILHTGGRRR